MEILKEQKRVSLSRSALVSLIAQHVAAEIFFFPPQKASNGVHRLSSRAARLHEQLLFHLTTGSKAEGRQVSSGADGVDEGRQVPENVSSNAFEQ